MNYRKLTTDEISRLIQQGCSADDWAQIEVASAFVCDYLHRVKFSGKNRLGVFEKTITLKNSVQIHSGIYAAWLHNCTIGNDVLIYNVRQYIANYIIEDHVQITDIGLLAVDGPTRFGNGIKVNVVNESGTHAIPIYEELSAQLAYLLVANRERPALPERVEKLIAHYCKEKENTTGVVALGAHISGCPIIENVQIGAYTCIENAQRLKNGAICSTQEAPVYIGTSCSFENFIIQSGASLNNGVLLSDCFIGQGGLFDKQFSASQSIFFANCEGIHGEACSVLAGPYTVTHHKSTLLIAGMFSFMNAGSGANQSNHAYKLGPIHHGLTERGVKLSSDSYLFWPAHIGAFTVVSGRHYSHLDISNYPFSYLVAQDGQPLLIPGVNFTNIGTWRDAKKWEQRDRRKGKKIDAVHYPLLNPYVVGKIQRGKLLLENIEDDTNKNLKIGAYEKQRGIDLYEFSETLYLLEMLAKKLEDAVKFSPNNIAGYLTAKETHGAGEWIDALGLLCPRSLWDALLKEVETGKIINIGQIAAAFEKMYDTYSDNAWSWVVAAFEKRGGKRPEDFSPTEMKEYIDDYQELAKQYTQQLCRDAQKEFAKDKIKTLGASGSWEKNNTVWDLLEQQEQREKKLIQLKANLTK